MEFQANVEKPEHAIKRHALPIPTNSSFLPDMFDTLEHWLASPLLAYSSWLARSRLKESSRKVYLAMFGRFCQWLNEQGRSLDRLEAADISIFLDSINPNLPVSRRRTNTGRQRQQYVRQLERVFSHLGALGHTGHNPGRKAGHERIGSGSDKPTRFLTADESDVLIRFIEAKTDELSRVENDQDEWMENRDLALIGVMVGGGLKVSHAIRLTLNCINMVEGHIDLSLQGRAHRARLLSFAAPALRQWLSLLERMHGGTLDGTARIFEADRSSGFGRHSNSITLSASSIHRRTQRLLGRAGISGERASPQTLRNTYAALLIDGGATDEHLVDYLGLHAAISAQRLRAAYARSKAGPAGNDPL